MNRTALPGRGGRWGRAAAATLGTGLAVSLAACATASPAFTPKPVVTVSPSAPPKPSSPTTSASSPTPAASATKASVKATGRLALFMPVTTALAGTCRTAGGASTITLADHKNDFYQTVDATVVLDAARKSVRSVDVAFGEDTEGFTWKLEYRSSKPVKGTSAKLATSGRTHTVSGKLRAVERRGDDTRTEVLPFKLVAKCAAADW